MFCSGVALPTALLWTFERFPFSSSVLLVRCNHFVHRVVLADEQLVGGHESQG